MWFRVGIHLGDVIMDGGQTLWYNPQLSVGWSLSGPPWSAPGWLYVSQT
ncbi:MAG: hypothetical protein V3S54_00825 [Woeseiaceae bacterium]